MESEYERGHAEGFINIPVDELRERIGEISTDKPVCVMRQNVVHSYIVCRILSQNGYNCFGGYAFYKVVMDNILAVKEIYPCGIEKTQ